MSEDKYNSFFLNQVLANSTNILLTYIVLYLIYASYYLLMRYLKRVSEFSKYGKFNIALSIFLFTYRDSLDVIVY